MIAYFDCFSGIAGDMTVAALLDAGADWDEFQRRLALLGLPGFSLRRSRVTRTAISGVLFEVLADDPPSAHDHHHVHHHHGRHLADIEALIGNSSLPARVVEDALAVFRALGEAEAAVHDVPVERIHFHEVGAVDSIVDIVGACICLDMLNVTRIEASALPVGRGLVRTAHGLMPIPAPATAHLCRDIPTYPVDVEGELVTPTGAALLATLASGFGPPPPMTARAVGYGAGSKDFGDRPNLLRVSLGDAGEGRGGWREETLLLLETDVDDTNPQVLPYVMDLCFEAGARDVTLAPVQMKKGRTGARVSVLCGRDARDAVLAVLARETTTLGVRVQEVQRHSLSRRFQTVETEYGAVTVKIAAIPGAGEKAHPEYESAREAARRANAPLRDVMAAALRAWENG